MGFQVYGCRLTAYCQRHYGPTLSSLRENALRVERTIRSLEVCHFWHNQDFFLFERRPFPELGKYLKKIYFLDSLATVFCSPCFDKKTEAARAKISKQYIQFYWHRIIDFFCILIVIITK